MIEKLGSRLVGYGLLSVALTVLAVLVALVGSRVAAGQAPDDDHRPYVSQTPV